MIFDIKTKNITTNSNYPNYELLCDPIIEESIQNQDELYFTDGKITESGRNSLKLEISLESGDQPLDDTDSYWCFQTFTINFDDETKSTLDCFKIDADKEVMYQEYLDIIKS